MAPFQVFGLDATPELSAIFLVYFVQGILGISRLAISYYFKDDLHMDPAQMAVVRVYLHVCMVEHASSTRRRRCNDLQAPWHTKT